MASSGTFLQRAGPLVVARFLSACLTIVIPLVLARAMELPDYGTYKQLFLIAQTIYYVLPFGMAQSLYYFLPRAEERRPFISQTLLFLAGAGAVAAVALYALGPEIASALNNPRLLEYRVSLALYGGFTLGGLSLELSMTAQGNTRRSAIAYLVSDGVRAVALVTPVLLGMGLSGLMASMVAYSAARLVAAWSLTLAGTRGPWFDRGLFVRQLAYAAPFGAAVLFSVPQTYAHQFMVSSVVSPAAFAIYAVGCFQLPLVDLLYTPTSEVLMVRLGELDRAGRPEEGLAAFQETTARLSYMFFPMAAFLFAAAPEFIVAIFGARFIEAVPIFRVSLLTIPLTALPMDGTLRARDRNRSLFMAYVIKAAVTVPLVYFGVRAFGMLGGVGSWMAAEVVGKSVLLARVPAALSTPGRRVRLAQLFPWPAMGKASLAAVLAGCGVLLVQFLAEPIVARLPHTFWYRLVPLSAVFGLFTLGYFTALQAVGVPPTAVFGWLVERVPVLGTLRRRTSAWRRGYLP